MLLQVLMIFRDHFMKFGNPRTVVRFIYCRTGSAGHTRTPCLYIPAEENDSLNDSIEENIPKSYYIPKTKTGKKRDAEDADWCESEDEYTYSYPIKKNKSSSVKPSRAKDSTLKLTERDRWQAKQLRKVLPIMIVSLSKEFHFRRLENSVIEESNAELVSLMSTF